MYICLYVNYPLFLSDFNENLIFFTDFLKILRYKISLEKSIQLEPGCSMQTDMMKLIVTFHNFVNVPTNVLDKIFKENQHVLCSIDLFPKIMPFMGQVEKYGTSRQATDDNIIQHIEDPR
jgi:hypothetical protein